MVRRSGKVIARLRRIVLLRVMVYQNTLYLVQTRHPTISVLRMDVADAFVKYLINAQRNPTAMTYINLRGVTFSKSVSFL